MCCSCRMVRWGKEPSRFSMAMVSTELLAARRQEARRKAEEGRLEQWLEAFIARVAALPVPPPSGTLVIPDYSRDVTVRFYQPDVRRKLLALIKTDVIRILDKNFMLNLQEKLYQSYWDDFEKRLLKRRVAEGERRKKLALRGVQGLDDNSLDDHPIIQVAKQVEANMAAHRSKKKKGQEKERTDCWEYAQFQTMSDLESEKSEVSLLEEDLADMDTWRKNVRKYENALEEALQIGLLPTEEVMENLKYEPPLVKQLRKLNGVEEMYDLADKILAIRGKSLND